MKSVSSHVVSKRAAGTFARFKLVVLPKNK